MPKEKKWILKETGDPDTVNRLASELGVDPVLALLLVQRGVTTFTDARAFFRPDLKNLHDPFLMKDMDKAVERIRRAVDTGEKILVYGDYDVDGTTAVSLVYSFLRRLTDRTDFYIPDRYDEGYGVSFKPYTALSIPATFATANIVCSCFPGRTGCGLSTKSWSITVCIFQIFRKSSPWRY